MESKGPQYLVSEPLAWKRTAGKRNSRPASSSAGLSAPGFAPADDYDNAQSLGVDALRLRRDIRGNVRSRSRAANK